MATKSRNELLDFLKGVSIVSVVMYHANIFPFGYLGVDVFFVVAGYLTICSYLNARSRFSVRVFFLGKLFRLVPLILCLGACGLALGYWTMLPDDYENLAESVFASNLFLNNVLMFITSADYWNVANDFKPMMHTWYLGVLGEFYLLMGGLIFVAGMVAKERKRRLFLLCMIILLSAMSVVTVGRISSGQRFYFIWGRFWEFGIGMISAFLVNKLPDVHLPRVLRPICWFGIGSYSIFVWHQFVFAFWRYFTGGLDGVVVVLGSLIVISLLAFVSYRLFETRRAVEILRSRYAIGIGLFLFLVTTGASWWLYKNSGVVRNVPELDIVCGKTRKGMNSLYNSRVYKFDHPFSSDDKVRVFVYGDSFARDFANIILETSWSNRVEISYMYPCGDENKIRNRISSCDCVVYAIRGDFQDIPLSFRDVFQAGKMLIVGTKRFGFSNGSIYIARGSQGYLGSLVSVEASMLVRNERQKNQFGDYYVDMITPLLRGGGDSRFYAVGQIHKPRLYSFDVCWRPLLRRYSI